MNKSSEVAKSLWLAALIIATLHFTKIFILKCERTIEKISFERHVYESVDDKSLSKVSYTVSHKSMESRTQEPKR